MTDLEKSLRDMVRSLIVEELRNAAPPPAEHISVNAYARRWSLSPTTVRRAIADKRLPAQRIGRAVRVRADAKIERRTTENAAQRAAERADLALVSGGKR